jgi:hypothetical protein
MIQHELRAYDEVLPRDVFVRLKRVLRAMAQPPHSHWIDAKKPPENLLESVVRRLEQVARPGASLAGAEWWLRRESASISKRLHFDRDETLAREGRVVHPKLASILYVTSVGGHTLVTDQSCSPDGTLSLEMARRRFVVSPRENRYLVFDGAVLHGVLPAVTGEDAERITLLVNWWDRPLSDAARRETSSEALGLARDATLVAAGTCRPSRSAVRLCVAAPAA